MSTEKEYLTGRLQIEGLEDFGFSTQIAVVLSSDLNVEYVQFNPESNIQDVYEGALLDGIGFIPIRQTDGNVGPMGILPPSRIGGGDGPVGVIPPIPIGGGRGPVGVLPGLRIADGRGPVGILPPSTIGGGNGPVGILPPIRIGGGDGPVGITCAVEITPLGKVSNDGMLSAQVTVRQMSKDDSSITTVKSLKVDIMIDRPLLKTDHDLAAVRTVENFRNSLNDQAGLSLDERILLVDQAIILFRDLYAHLPLKRAMHSIDPIQRLRLLKQRADEMSIFDFHADLLNVFKELRDLHTNLTLPAPFGSQIAFLGIFVERYFKEDKPRYIVSKIYDNLIVDDALEEGVEITHWNGMQIDAAVARNAEKEAGSNQPSRMARGLETMTLRSLRSSLLPDEDWVDLTYLDKDNRVQQARLPWLVFDSPREINEAKTDALGLAFQAPRPVEYNLGVDERQELLRRAKKVLFNPKAMKIERAASKSDDNQKHESVFDAKGAIQSRRPDEISAKLIDVNGQKFGYLRLWTFLMRDRGIEAFLLEFIRQLEEEMPPDGLIIDVRGNGGGYIIAAEFLLQLLTHRRIDPEPAQFIATAGCLEFVNAVPEMAPWRESMRQAVETGALFSKGVPISSAADINSIGQIYFGPVVLITDAYCYSACDMFAAGFQDHQIGTLLGVDTRTGAGGANVVTHNSLIRDWPGGPLKPLPGGAGMRVSLRRTMRVGAQSGDPVEDLGVTPDELHRMTHRDLMDGNSDLLKRATDILKRDKPRKFDVLMGVDGEKALFEVNALRIDSYEVYVQGRHAKSGKIDKNGNATFSVTPGVDRATVELIGYFENKVVARRVIKIE